MRFGGRYWKKRKRWLGGQIRVLGDHFDMMSTTKTTTQTQNVIKNNMWVQNKTKQKRVQKLLMNKDYAVCGVLDNSLCCGPRCGTGTCRMFCSTI